MPACFVKFQSFRMLILGLAVTLVSASPSFAQFNNGNNFFGSVVGGIHIDAQGVLQNQRAQMNPALVNEIMASLQAADTDINQSTKLRMISLKGLDATIQKYTAEGKRLPADVQYLAGLQRVEFVIASPETGDVILAGPGEGWKVNALGDVVGKTTGMPVLRLEDLLVALRSVHNARQGQGVTVSIDPTQEGTRRLQNLQKQLVRQNVNFSREVLTAFENALGDQKITLTGIPADSRFSQILVAADYRMKRYSMGLEQTPVRNMPSLPEIAKRKNVNFNNRAPRFWMEANYEPVAVSADKNVWQLRGQGIKTMTENAFFDKSGVQRREKGKSNKYAQAWADSMTENYEELSKSDPVFRELRNVFDMSVVAAIIANESLMEKVNLSLGAMQNTSQVSIPKRNVPKTVPSQASFVKLASDWLIFTSGGIQVDSWAVANRQETVGDLAKVAEVATTKTANRWWWNSK